MEILTTPNKLLNKKCVDVNEPLSANDIKILNDMYAFVKDKNNKAVGLAAPQIGICKRLFVIKAKDPITKKTVSLKIANPQIIKLNQKPYCVPGGETCLSEPELPALLIPRATTIMLTGYELNGNSCVKICKTFSKYIAAIIQHEVDHLDGVLLRSYMSRRDWEDLNEEKKKQEISEMLNTKNE